MEKIPKWAPKPPPPDTTPVFAIPPIIPLSSAKVGSNLTYFQSKVCQPGLLSIQSNLLSIQSNSISIQSNGDQRGRHRDQRGRRRRGINRKDVSQVTDFGKFGFQSMLRRLGYFGKKLKASPNYNCFPPTSEAYFGSQIFLSPSPARRLHD